MARLFANNASTTLTAQLTAVATSMTVANGSVFPSPSDNDFFLATLIGYNSNGQENAWEVVRCTTRAANDVAIVRAQEGTSAALWPVSTRVELRITAGSMAPTWQVHDGSVGSGTPIPLTPNSSWLVNDTSSVQFALPAGTAGATIRLKTGADISPSSYVRLIPNGSEMIAGQAGGTTLDIDKPYTDITLVYSTTLGWVI
jgi:hypothetical protein